MSIVDKYLIEYFETIDASKVKSVDLTKPNVQRGITGGDILARRVSRMKEGNPFRHCTDAQARLLTMRLVGRKIQRVTMTSSTGHEIAVEGRSVPLTEADLIELSEEYYGKRLSKYQVRRELRRARDAVEKAVAGLLRWRLADNG